MEIIKIIIDGNHYDVCCHHNGTQYHSICGTEEKVVESVKKYLAMRKQDEAKSQAKPLTGNEQLELNKIQAAKGVLS